MTTAPTAPTALTSTRYLEPDLFTRKVFNPLVRRLTLMGISVWGSSELRIKGRKTGEWRSNVVNPLPLGDSEFLVAPRGTTQWVRNLRAAGGGELRVGRRVDTFTFAELADDDKIPVLRAYLKKWKFEVGQFFEGISAESSDDDLRAIAAGFPVFRLTRAAR